MKELIFLAGFAGFAFKAFSQINSGIGTGLTTLHHLRLMLTIRCDSKQSDGSWVTVTGCGAGVAGDSIWGFHSNQWPSSI